MKLICSVVLFAVMSIVSVSEVRSEEMKDVYSCGIAQGYPPYQFQNDAGEPVGLDVDVLKLVFEKMNKKVIFRQDKWNNIVANLCYGDLDCVGGMEVNQTRRSCFDFTTPYYSRRITVFVLADNNDIQNIQDLKWQTIAGDRHSFVEQLFKKQGLMKQIRIFQTKSKDESMRLLKEGTVAAVIAPRAVGSYLAKKYEINVRMLEYSDQGSPVALAVKKGNDALLQQLESALMELEQDGKLNVIFKKWGIQ
ncbi:transporter substrate-binding domain-containing protein [uncultured Pseudodesulfovibrio sp.]|uniref:transporter substrate-binding domain-containing protein n=1 Tax=uncultured Pseudodesulfovibrio sp. TaxID=2035858 RepID=UPI0029C853A1|nr:transporter substrate-binding domain-containing protein [uncultured Pseudodesulfovibrio sp.]